MTPPTWKNACTDYSETIVFLINSIDAKEEIKVGTDLIYIVIYWTVTWKMFVYKATIVSYCVVANWHKVTRISIDKHLKR